MLPKKGKRAGLPKRVRSHRVHAQGVGGGHNTRIETCSFFFVPVPFFFLTQVRQFKVVFLRTLRNAATRLVLIKL